ncbi:MAG: methyltransferase domain-containing protein [Armatimonadetes bacterium]|nr:methyltransferase domain-containing protein [Armatimonadota bacterium]
MNHGAEDLRRLQRFATVGICPSCRKDLDQPVLGETALTCPHCSCVVRIDGGVLWPGSSELDGWAAGIAADMDRKGSSYVAKYRVYTRESRGFLIRRQNALEMAGTNPGRVLEAGCGPGVVAPLMAQRGLDTHGIDLSAEQLRTAVARDVLTLYVQGNLTELPYRASVFDTVVLLGALEYVEEPRQVMEELARVTVPQGRIVLSVPNASSLPRLWTQYAYLPVARTCKRLLGWPTPAYSRRLYSLRRLTDLLESTGLRVDESRFFDLVLAAPPADRLFRRRPPRVVDSLEARLKGPLRRLLATQIVVKAVPASN